MRLRVHQISLPFPHFTHEDTMKLSRLLLCTAALPFLLLTQLTVLGASQAHDRESENPARRLKSAATLSVVEPDLLPDGAYTGEVRTFAGEKLPKGWLPCDGKEYDQTAYPRLFAAISDLWGSQTAGKFRVPDLRGVGMRGWNQERNDKYRDSDIDGRELVPGAPGYPNGDKNHVGTYQMDQFQTHRHNDSGHAHSISNTGYHDAFACGPYCGALTGGGTVQTTPANANVTEPAPINEPLRVGSETRSKNAYVLYGIRDGNRR